eukprot:SAG31_NODE_30915_length_374_cov_1.312727_1_plen_71_part_10
MEWLSKNLQRGGGRPDSDTEDTEHASASLLTRTVGESADDDGSNGASIDSTLRPPVPPHVGSNAETIDSRR